MDAYFRQSWLVYGLGLFLCLSPAFALEALTPRQRRDLELLAAGRARLALAQEIQSTVRLRGSNEWPEELQLALRYWLRSSAEVRPVRFYANQLAETDASIAVADLNTWLVKQEVDSRRPRDQLLWGTGTAEVADLPTDMRPLGWRYYVAETVESTRRQAEDNAVIELLKAHVNLLASAEIELPNHLEADDTLVAQWERAIRARGALQNEAEPDELSAGIIRLKGEDFVAILAQMHPLSDEQRVMLERVLRDQTLKAVGLSAPSAKDRLPGRAEPVEVDRPAWVSHVLRCDGVIGGRKDEEDKRREAHVAALDALRQAVLALEIRDGVSLERYLEREAELKPDVVKFLSGARLSRTIVDQRKGTVRVEVMLPLARLWEIVKGAMRAVPAGG